MTPALPQELAARHVGASRPPAARSRTDRDISVEVDSLTPDAWDRLIGEFDDIALDQTAVRAEDEWGPARASHFVLRRNGVAVAGARVAIRKLPGWRRGLAYTRFGPFWRRRGSCDPDLYGAAVSALVQEYGVRRGHCVTVLPRPNPVHYARECAVLAEHGFVPRRPLRDANRYLEDLSLAEDAQLRSLDQKWRYNLRQALRNGIEVRLCDDGLAAYMELHAAMVSRKRFHDGGPLHLVPALSARLPEGMRPQVILALHGGRPVFGAVIAVLGDTAYYLFGASADEALQLKAGYALHWWVLRRLAESGARWYDLGTDVCDAGLRQFKKGLVGKAGAVVVMDSEYDRCTNLPSRLATDAIYGIRDLKRAVRTWRDRRGNRGTGQQAPS